MGAKQISYSLVGSLSWLGHFPWYGSPKDLIQFLVLGMLWYHWCQDSEGVGIPLEAGRVAFVTEGAISEPCVKWGDIPYFVHTLGLSDT